MEEYGFELEAEEAQTVLVNNKQIPLPIDMTDILKFQELVDDISKVNSTSGPYFMQELLKAKDMAGIYYSRVVLEYEKAKDESKKKASIAYLEKAQEYLTKQGRKVTEEACKRFVEVDEDYIKARSSEHYYKALAEFMKQKLDYFSSAHDDAKKIFGESKDGYGGMTGAASKKDAYE